MRMYSKDNSEICICIENNKLYIQITEEDGCGGIDNSIDIILNKDQAIKMKNYIINNIK